MSDDRDPLFLALDEVSEAAFAWRNAKAAEARIKSELGDAEWATYNARERYSAAISALNGRAQRIDDEPAAASTAVVGSPQPGSDATVDGTAGTTAEPSLRGAHVDDRVTLAGGPPGPAVHSTTGDA